MGASEAPSGSRVPGLLTTSNHLVRRSARRARCAFRANGCTQHRGTLPRRRPCTWRPPRSIRSEEHGLRTAPAPCHAATRAKANVPCPNCAEPAESLPQDCAQASGLIVRCSSPIPVLLHSPGFRAASSFSANAAYRCDAASMGPRVIGFSIRLARSPSWCAIAWHRPPKRPPWPDRMCTSC